MRRFLLLLLFIAQAALAQDRVEVISLKHRTAEQMIPLLRPLLEPGGALSGQFNQLIVRTSPANLTQIRTALDAMDQPIRRLLISVRFDNAQQSASSSVDADARISTRGSIAGVRIEDSRSVRDEQADQRIQVLEGGQAFISSGESRPFGETASGFSVVPRLSGGSVFLEIFTQQENFARGGAVQGQRTSGSVNGRLGEWIELVASDATRARAESGILSSRDARASTSRRIWVKVEELRN